MALDLGAIVTRMDLLDREFHRKVQDAQNRLARLEQEGKRHTAGLADGLRLAQKVAGALGVSLTAAFAVNKLREFNSQVLQVASGFEKMELQVRTLARTQAEAAQEFQKVRRFAAESPLRTDEVIQSFTQIKAAIGEVSLETINTLGGVALTFDRDLRDIVAGFIGLETEVLRRLGVMLDRSGEMAVIQSGDVTKRVKNDIRAIQQALLEVWAERFPDAMAKASDLYTSKVRVMESEWQEFLAKVAETSGTLESQKGQVDAVTEALKRARDEQTGFFQIAVKIEAAWEAIKRNVVSVATGIEIPDPLPVQRELLQHGLRQAEETVARLQGRLKDLALDDSFLSILKEGALGTRADTEEALNRALKAREGIIRQLDGLRRKEADQLPEAENDGAVDDPSLFRTPDLARAGRIDERRKALEKEIEQQKLQAVELREGAAGLINYKSAQDLALGVSKEQVEKWRQGALALQNLKQDTDAQAQAIERMAAAEADLRLDITTEDIARIDEATKRIAGERADKLERARELERGISRDLMTELERRVEAEGDALRERLQLIQKNVEDEGRAWHLRERAVEAHGKRVAEIQAEANKGWLEKIRDQNVSVEEMGVQAARNLENAWEKFFFDVMENRVKNLGDLWKGLDTIVKQMAASILARQAQLALFGEKGGGSGLIGAALSIGAGLLGGDGGAGAAAAAESSGVIGALSAAGQSVPFDGGGVSRGPGLFHQGDITEAHVPLPDGRAIPVRMDDRGGERPINIYNLFDRSLLPATLGPDDVVNIISADMLGNGRTRRAVREVS